MRHSLMYPMADSSTLAFDFGREYSSCDRILFRNPNYTNINWVGLWVTIISLSVLCIASFIVKWLDTTTRAALGLCLGACISNHREGRYTSKNYERLCCSMCQVEE